MQTQILTIKKSKPKKSRPKDLKPANGKTPALSRIDEPRKTSYQNKKKKYLQKKQNWKNFSLATRDNTIKGEKK